MSKSNVTPKMFSNIDIKSVCSQFFEDLEKATEEQDRVYNTILYFIHAAPHLSRLYLKWSDLHILERFILNVQMGRSLSATTRTIYSPVVRAFEYWDMLQDKYGAPGYSTNPIRNKISKETDKAIVEALLIMEKTINQIYIKREMLKEMAEYDDPCSILYGYKWRIVSRHVSNRAASRHKKSKMSAGGEISDEENSSDLNGCGDSTWFTDS